MRKGIKKLLTVALTATLGLAALAGCGTGNDNGWMITVPLHKEGEILFPVCIEKLIIVTRPFHNSPGIKSLIVNIHTKPVTDFHQCGRRWIVHLAAFFSEAGSEQSLCLVFLFSAPSEYTHLQTDQVLSSENEG